MNGMEMMKMRKMLVFDMDGTIADLYNVPNWLTDLVAENVRPYATAAPLVDFNVLIPMLYALKAQGWRIAVTTWLAKDGSKEYGKAVAVTKRTWLDSYGFPYDEFHAVKYGTTKANCTRKKGGFQILVDDNKKIRNGWNLGLTIDANCDIIKEIEKLLN